MDSILRESMGFRDSEMAQNRSKTFKIAQKSLIIAKNGSQMAQNRNEGLFMINISIFRELAAKPYSNILSILREFAVNIPYPSLESSQTIFIQRVTS